MEYMGEEQKQRDKWGSYCDIYAKWEMMEPQLNRASLKELVF